MDKKDEKFNKKQSDRCYFCDSKKVVDSIRIKESPKDFPVAVSVCAKCRKEAEEYL